MCVILLFLPDLGQRYTFRYTWEMIHIRKSKRRKQQTKRLSYCFRMIINEK